MRRVEAELMRMCGEKCEILGEMQVICERVEKISGQLECAEGALRIVRFGSRDDTHQNL